MWGRCRAADRRGLAGSGLGFNARKLQGFFLCAPLAWPFSFDVCSSLTDPCAANAVMILHRAPYAQKNASFRENTKWKVVQVCKPIGSPIKGAWVGRGRRGARHPTATCGLCCHTLRSRTSKRRPHSRQDQPPSAGFPWSRNLPSSNINISKANWPR